MKLFLRYSPCCRLLLALCVGLSLISPLALAQSEPEPELARYETALLGVSHPEATLENRVADLECYVFGLVQSGSVVGRKTTLLKILAESYPSVSSPAVVNTPTANSTNSNSIGPVNDTTLSVTDAPDATDYPAVSAMEQQVLGRDFIHENIRSRLGRLEQRIFGQVFYQEPLSDRVDRLDQAIASQPEYQVPADAAGFTRLPPGMRGASIQDLPTNDQALVGTGSDVYRKLDVLEAAFLSPADRKQDNSKKLVSERLDRLERTVLGTTFTGDSIDLRLNRLLNTADSHTAYGTPPRQNIRVGSQFQEHGQYQVSPEFMRMIPPDMQNRFSVSPDRDWNQGSSWQQPLGDGTVSSGTVTSSFRVYSIGPSGAPGRNWLQPHQQTTVIQTTIPPTVITTLPPAAPLMYTPAFLQSLNNLELSAFGQINAIDPVAIRLNRLEAQLLGQNYMAYPPEIRLQNLERVAQGQSLGKMMGKSRVGRIGRTVGGALLGVPMQPPELNPLSP